MNRLVFSTLVLFGFSAPAFAGGHGHSGNVGGGFSHGGNFSAQFNHSHNVGGNFGHNFGGGFNHNFGGGFGGYNRSVNLNVGLPFVGGGYGMGYGMGNVGLPLGSTYGNYSSTSVNLGLPNYNNNAALLQAQYQAQAQLQAQANYQSAMNSAALNAANSCQVNANLGLPSNCQPNAGNVNLNLNAGPVVQGYPNRVRAIFRSAITGY